MKISLKTLSPLLSASGESSAHIDADVKYDKYGFPYIQAKTFKGLLRESAIEVCEIVKEIQTEEDYCDVNMLFGKTGWQYPGILAFNNLHIKDYAAIVQELSQNGDILNPESVKKHFTESRHQTTITHGTAKDKSLRKYRLIREGVEFETQIENVPPDKVEFLKTILLNLRYIGTRRNRGFGKIILEVSDIYPRDATIIKADLSGQVMDYTLSKMSFDIKTMDTLLISKIFGEQNTVSTEKYIPAQKIRGLVAGLIIRDKNLGGHAQKDDTFREIILAGKVKFCNAFITGAQPVPRLYGYNKNEPGSNAEIIFEKDSPLKAIDGFAAFSANEMTSVKVETTFSFHNSRSDNRLAGRSTKEDGAIYYYEGIAPNQVFSGELIGSRADLNYIKTLVQQNGGIHRIGKSKTAQYSKIRFDNFRETDLMMEGISNRPSPVYIVFQSPVITYNEFGLAIPDVSVLKTELAPVFNRINKISIASAPELVETYMGVWQSKTPRETAFDIGTTLKIEFDGNADGMALTNLESDGLGERKAEGYGRIRIITPADSLERKNDLENHDTNDNNDFINPFHHELLRTLFDHQIEDAAENTLKLTAIENSANYKLPNSLISRLKDELNRATEPGWENFIAGIKGKKAYKTLDLANLWESVSRLKIPGSLPDHEIFSIKKTYWLAFFQALRVKQNKLNRNGK